MRPDLRARAWAGVALIALTACGGADEDVVARVGDETLTVDQVAEYMQARFGKDGRRAWDSGMHTGMPSLLRCIMGRISTKHW